ncbi:putative tyrosinase central domain protein [Rosellinia necatrix]|uniref:Putative tyrosinase central domain protein n=1 Tax=Rosellinia necatrix TaxID=77044 RepID=A0A1W2TKF3_ROSNE|nr:putative tyrosinase central domain protein [Rosellinia necatrix]
MRFLSLSVTSLLLLAKACSAGDANADVASFLDQYRESSALRLGAAAHHERAVGADSCNASNIRVRKSWYNLSLPERKDYIDAVKCLREKPAVTEASFSSGARNRIDDFAACHVNQTLFVHFSGWFLPWHRYFVWQYETALRDECGYTGAQPYWDWSLYTDDFSADPLFDGSEYSLGGNGVYVPHDTLSGNVPGVPEPQFISRAPGTGGGCVVDGPFANITLNLGPVFPVADGSNRTGLEYNPHCMTRDFLQEVSQQFLTNASLSTLFTQPSMAAFRNDMEQGSHGGGHSYVGGDMFDIFSSPQDPVFYFHHTQVDRMWAIWQEQDPDNRLYAVSDTQTWANSPPSPNVTITDILDYGYVGGRVVMSEVVDPLSGRLCYRYE